MVSVNGIFLKNLFQIFSNKIIFLFRSRKIFMKDPHCFENYILVHVSFFCATISFWDMVEFVYGWLHHIALSDTLPVCDTPLDE